LIFHGVSDAESVPVLALPNGSFCLCGAVFSPVSADLVFGRRVGGTGRIPVFRAFLASDPFVSSDFRRAFLVLPELGKAGTV